MWLPVVYFSIFAYTSRRNMFCLPFYSLFFPFYDSAWQSISWHFLCVSKPSKPVLFFDYFCYSLSYFHRFATGVISNLCSPWFPRNSSPKCITVASNSLVLYTSHNYKNSKPSDDLVCLLSFSLTPVHYCISLYITDYISQSLCSLFKEPTLVKVARLYAGFLWNACSHVADQVSRQACCRGRYSGLRLKATITLGN